MQVDKFYLSTLLSIDLHFFIATIQIGVIVQVCYTPPASKKGSCSHHGQ